MNGSGNKPAAASTTASSIGARTVEPAIVEPSQQMQAETDPNRKISSTAKSLQDETHPSLPREVSQDPSLLPPRGHYGEEHDYHHFEQHHQARFVSQDPASQNPLDLQVKVGVWDGFSYDDGDAAAERSSRHAHHKLRFTTDTDATPSTLAIKTPSEATLQNVLQALASPTEHDLDEEFWGTETAHPPVDGEEAMDQVPQNDDVSANYDSDATVPKSMPEPMPVKLSSKRILYAPSEPTPKRRKQQHVHVPRDHLLESNSDDEYQRGRRRGTSAELSGAPNGLGGNDPNGSDGVSEGFGSHLSEEKEQILESLYRQFTSSKKGKVRLLKESGLSDEQRDIVRKAYRKLQENVCHSHQGDKIEDPMSQAVHFALGRNNFLFPLAKHLREGVMDAETLDQIGRRAARQTDKLTHVPRYDVDRFIGQLDKKLGVRQGGTRHFDWRTLGREAGVCFNAVPSRVAFLHGPATADYVPKERKKREHRKSSAEDDDEDDGEEQPDELKHTADQKACGALSKVEQQVKSTAEQLVKRSREARQEAMKVWESSSVQLSKDEKKKRKKLIASRYGLEIDMLEFIVDRTSFTKTVENLFHLSFVGKGGKARGKVRTEEEAALYGGPVSCPMVRAVPNKMSNRANWANPPRQCIISLNMSEWRELCKLFDEGGA